MNFVKFLSKNTFFIEHLWATAPSNQRIRLVEETLQVPKYQPITYTLEKSFVIAAAFEGL